MSDDQKFLKIAAEEGLNGTPPHLFGAVVEKDGEVLSAEHNHVWERHDPSAHAEVSAIVKACKKLANHNLEGCTLYASHEPCLMCFSCAAWAEIERIVFATAADEQTGDSYEFSGVSIFELAKKLKKPMKVEHISKSK